LQKQGKTDETQGAVLLDDYIIKCGEEKINIDK
jgi:hypothetical protein